jgi:hypothetical protein
LLKAAVAGQQLRQDRELAGLEQEIARLWQASSSQRESQEREAKAAAVVVAEVRKVVGQLAGELEVLRSENGRQGLAVGDVARVNDQLREGAGELRLRIEALEQENRRLSEANEILKRDLGEVCGRCPKANEDFRNPGREPRKRKEEMKAVHLKPEPLAPPPPPPKQGKRFSPSVKKVKAASAMPGKSGKEIELDVPEGIIGHLTRECGGNVHDCNVVVVTSGSFEKETDGLVDNPRWAAQRAADLRTDSSFGSGYRKKKEDIMHTRNNWLCYDFKERRVVPTHYTIRSFGGDSGLSHLKSWAVETSADGKDWREVDHKEDNEQLNGNGVTGTFAITGGVECRFIRLVNIGSNHRGNDLLQIQAWEIFGSLIE